jgi:hypothetical protein
MQGCTTVFMGNLSYSIDDDKLKDWVKDCGEVKNIRWCVACRPWADTALNHESVDNKLTFSINAPSCPLTAHDNHLGVWQAN